MNQLLLSPSDVLFFRDGRPMGGSLAGHGAAWPLPTVTNAALHAALWRAGDTFEKVHSHRRGKSGDYSDQRDRKFGSLATAGPFPVLKDGAWLFPGPLDVGLTEDERDTTGATLLPLSTGFDKSRSSLAKPLRYAVANTRLPTKKRPQPWWNRAAWEQYLGTEQKPASPGFFSDAEFSDTEFSYGIGIDPETATQNGEQFYSAHYLRLKPGCRMGLLASAKDKGFRDPSGNDDLLAALFPNSGAETPVIVGGQQRLCSVRRDNPKVIGLPRGKSAGFNEADGRLLVKWVLLSPAIFPEITAGTSKRGTERKAHPGGWLPTWICPETGKVLLQTIDQEERKRRRQLNAAGTGYESNPNIDATLVAAITGKPIPVTGYALPHETTGAKGGTKPTHLAVPAGSVYYFECASADAAGKLAAALNWHGAGDFSTIRNRRSTLFGEKGFGLGVCGTWQFHDGKLPS